MVFLTITFFWSCKKLTHQKTETKKESNIVTSISKSIIVGKYVYDENGIDEITLIVSKKYNKYFYNLKTKVRNINGDLSIVKYPDKNTYLKLDGIKWQLNKCNVDDESDESEKQVKDSVSGVVKKNIPPMEIELFYEEDELVLQNGLNSFEFVPLPECCEYYIHLLKK